MSDQMPFPGGFDPQQSGTDPQGEPSHRRRNLARGAAALAVVAALGGAFLVGHASGSDAPATAEAVTTSAAPLQTQPTLAVKTVAPSPPVKIEIPSIGVSDDFVDLHLNPDGTLEVPTDYQQVGWYADGAVPGDTNKPPTIIAGHVDSYQGPAVFFDLDKVKIGDQVRVTQQDGTIAVYDVYAASQYPKTEFPASEVYKTRSASELVLITCTGAFDRTARSYDDNLVLSARLVPELSGTAG